MQFCVIFWLIVVWLIVFSLVGCSIPKDIAAAQAGRGITPAEWNGLRLGISASLST